MFRRLFKSSGQEAAVNKNSAEKRRIPFSASVYTPRWRLKNYYALKEFGPMVKRWYIEQRYTYHLGEFPDLDNPKTFNEKIHWLNLNYQNPLITRCCDKYEMKNYVREILGSGHTAEVLQVYEKANDIDFSSLPDKFALKVNWGDGSEFSFVTSDKSAEDINVLKARMSSCLCPWNNLYYSHFFWGYKNVVPKLFAEEYIEHTGTDLTDYKVHCFNGKAEIILVCEDRSAGPGMKKTFLDREWNVLECRRSGSSVNSSVKKPDVFSEMIAAAEKLAEPFPFVRADFYISEGRIIVGEMTFHPGCGFEEFYPYEWNRKLGDMLTLPEKMITENE